MSWPFASWGQSMGASTSASVLPMNIQSRFPLGLSGLTFLLSSYFKEASPTLQCKSINSLVLSFLYGPTLTSVHDYQKNDSFTMWTFVSKVTSLLFNMLFRFVIAFLRMSKCLLISYCLYVESLTDDTKELIYKTETDSQTKRIDL